MAVRGGGRAGTAVGADAGASAAGGHRNPPAPAVARLGVVEGDPLAEGDGVDDVAVAASSFAARFLLIATRSKPSSVQYACNCPLTTLYALGGPQRCITFDKREKAADAMSF